MATIKPNSYVLNVDIKQRMSNKTPRFVQFDEAQIVFKIYDGGKPFDLSGFTSAVVTHKTRSNQVISGYGTFEDLNGQRVVVYDYMGSEMKELGNVETSLSIYNDENDKVSVMPFNVQIVRDLSHEYSEKDTSVLQDLIAKTTDAISKIEYAEDQGDYAKEQGTFAETQGNHAKTQGDYAQTQGTRAETLGNKAETQVGQAQDILDVAVPAYERVEEVYSNTVNLENQHAYDATKQYHKNNIVEFNGSSYQALQDTKGNQPPVNASNEYWSLLARKGADGTGTVVRHREEFISTEGQTTFTLKNTYDQFQNRIDVTVGNVPQFSPDNFTEATNTSIKLNEPLPAGIQVVVTYFSEAQPLKNDIQTVVNNHTTNLSAINQEIEDIKVIRHREEFVTTEGQDTFTLKNEYDMNQNRVDVVAGGVPQYSPEHFIEFTNKSIKFTEPFPAGELVIVTYFGKATPLLYDVDTVLDNHSVRLNTSEAELTSISQQLAENVEYVSDISHHLKKWGVNADGSTDDTNIINQAITDVSKNGGGTITGTPNAVYGIAGEVKLKSNVTIDLNGGTLKRVGTATNIKILRNANYGSSSVIDKNMGIKNLAVEGTGHTVGVSDQGGGIGFFVADGILIENVKTNNTNGDGIQWRKADNVTIRNVDIGDFGRNGIAPTSGLNTVWDNVKIVGNPLPGANPGKDIDAETNKPSTEEKGTHFANNIQCRNLTLVDFFTPDGGDFSQEWMFNNCIIGDGYKALQIRSTNKTIAKNVFISSNCEIRGSGSDGNAIWVENVSGVKMVSPTVKVGSSTGNNVGIVIVGEVSGLDISGVDVSRFRYGMQAFGASKLNNSHLKNSKLGNLYLSGSDNRFSSVNIDELTLNGATSLDNVFDASSNINRIRSVNSGSITNQHFGDRRGSRSKAFYSIEERVTDGSLYDLKIPLPSGAGTVNGRMLTVIAGYSHKGHSGHWASLIAAVRIGDTDSGEAAVIANNNDGTRKIEVVEVTNTAITLRLTYQFGGTFSATVIG